MKKYFILLLIKLLIVSICISQKDASLTYIDLIAKNNQSVIESRNQKIINWDEVPFKIDTISRIKQTYYITQIDTSISSDTTIIIDSNIENAIRTYSQVYDFVRLSDDTLKIVIDTSFIITYENDKIISQKEDGSIMYFNYYKSGLLKELVVDDNILLQSKKVEDTINYSLNFLDPISNQPVQSEYIPTLKIKCIEKDKDCFHYKNIYLLKKMSEEPIVNKEIVQCSNGNITNEIILNRYKNYTQKEKDYKFEYDKLVLRKKICNPDIEYSQYQNIEYEYDKNENLKKIIGSTITTEFKYDDRDNVILRIDYFTGSKSLQKFWVREIEYIE